MEWPLVSVICLSYNHARYIEEAVHSVLHQTYKNIELILVDDASRDHSQEKIREMASGNARVQTLLLSKNVGNCKAFNQGLALAKGEYIIDLAADDVLLPSRIEEGVKILEISGPDYGVHFSDADWINDGGDHLYHHSERFPHATVPQGDIYKELISRYFICPASTMVRRKVFEYLNGYDESLTYEDFDFLIRSSRKFKFVYSPSVLVKKRITINAQSKKQFQFFSGDALSTFKICEKILSLNRNKSEQSALRKRIFYEIRLNIRLLNLQLVLRYIFLLKKNSQLVY